MKHPFVKTLPNYMSEAQAPFVSQIKLNLRKYVLMYVKKRHNWHTFLDKIGLKTSDRVKCMLNSIPAF